ncbi:cilia- and flagella-associated protein 157-like [Sphaeramia orbicularis]|uniref:cilia- and flagella-associated protein 157-like n=1 Tax=Sphaeramia orbicularis TaxID=375764 RepID=UPI00117D4818|nr:cilia- and flagella-associated protein 157-like [Sphaeramia orbicularis]
MPKKKDKKTSEQDEDNKTRKKESRVASVDKTASDDKEKRLYLTQIRYLNEQLERYQLKCDELERQKKDFSSQYNVLEKEKRDIVEYLKCSLLEKEEEVNMLHERLENERQTAQKEQDTLQQQHRLLIQELHHRNDELAAENMTLVQKLDALEEFQKQREQLVSKMESLKNQVASQEQEHKAAIHSLEMKALLERNRLEKEMQSQAASMAAEVQHLVEQNLPEATRLAIEENKEVRSRCSQLSDHACGLLKVNTALQTRKTKLRLDVDILEQMVSDISRKSCIQKKLVEQLTEKCEQLQTELRDCREEHRQLQTKHSHVLTEIDQLREDKTSISKQCKKNKTDLSQLEVELQNERRRRKMKSIRQEAVIISKQTVNPPQPPCRPVTDDSGDQELEVKSVARWRQLMQKLLVVLDRPTLSNSISENSQTNDLQPADPEAAREGNLNASVNFQLACNRPADLG